MAASLVPGCRARCDWPHDGSLHASRSCRAEDAPLNDQVSSLSPPAAAAPQPLKGLRVVEFTHMVMGPTCGMVLADLGAEVIKVEPIEGEGTRRLLGAGAGFFPMFNRNKLSIGIDLKQAEGAAIAQRLAASADVVAENFKPGALHKFGLDYASLSARNDRLIMVSHKGFLPGPYQHRTALDEVVQMMGGLAYMTGRPGDPLRAGTSVNDIMGGLFGAIAVLGALVQRGITGKGMEVQSALFENNVFLMGQHMLQFAVTGQHPRPMPARDNPWAVYDVFTVADDEQIFLAAVSDAQWVVFCDVLGFADLKADPGLRTNNDRVRVRPQLLATLRERLKLHTAADLAALFEAAGLPFAPIRRPEDLLDDPHLLATGGLADIDLPDHGGQAKSTLLPIMLAGQRLGVRLHPPRFGAHTDALLAGLGYAQADIDQLKKRATVA
ncbi:MAG: CoA transferase [Burkholderiales bacterium]|nr:CoA transferase [Burkholderiales bacterium]